MDPSAVSRGSSLDRDDNGLLTLAGGKITDYRKMAEGAMERVLNILKEEFDRQFKLINSKTYPVSGGEINPTNVDSEIEAFAQLGVSRGWIVRKPTISQIFTVQMHRKSLLLLIVWNKRQDSAWQTLCPFTMQCAMSWL